jgi:hypothetical protein
MSNFEEIDRLEGSCPVRSASQGVSTRLQLKMEFDRNYHFELPYNRLACDSDELEGFCSSIQLIAASYGARFRILTRIRKIIIVTDNKDLAVDLLDVITAAGGQLTIKDRDDFGRMTCTGTESR